MACYFIIICMPYDVLYIIWVLNDNTKKSTVHAPVWPLDVCCETSVLSTFVLADTDKIEYRLRQVVNLPWTGVQARGFHPISTTETRNKTTTLIGRWKNENIYANTFNNLDYLFTEHELIWLCFKSAESRETVVCFKYYKFVTKIFLSKLKLTVN